MKKPSTAPKPHTHEVGVADPVLTRLVAEDKVPWYRKPNLRYLYLMLFPACMGVEMTSGFDSQIINAVQLVDPWQECEYLLERSMGDGSRTRAANYKRRAERGRTGLTYNTEIDFNHPRGALLGIIGAAYSLGAILSLPFIPMLNDRFGRRWSIMFGSIVMCIGALLQGFSNGIGMYIVARLFLGFGIPFCIIAASSLIGELGYPKERPVLTSLFNASWFVGSIIAASVTYGTQTLSASDWSWRIPSLLQMAPSFLQIALVFFVPESPRFLMSKDRQEEAKAILVRYHAEGDESSVFVQAEIKQIESTIKLELENSKRSWTEMVSAAGMRRRTILASFLGLFTQWSGNTLISYYLNDLLLLVGITDTSARGRINIANTCWSLMTGTIAALLVRRFPRRVMYLVCTCSLLCVYTGWTVSMERAITTETTAAAGMVLFFIFAYSPAYNIGYNALTYTYLVELFPFAQRSRGIAIYQLTSRMAGFFSTFVNPIGLNNITWRYLIVYCCWLAFEICFVYFLFPETSKRTLEELAFLFEDKRLAEEATVAVEKEIHGDNLEKKYIAHVEVIDAGNKERD